MGGGGYTSKMDREKLLIIGCGDLGQRLARHLAGTGVEITGLRRRPRDSDDQTPELRYVAANATDEMAMMTLLREGFDTIVMTLTPAERSEAGYQRGYVRPCEVLVQSLQVLPKVPRQILFASSTAVYGQQQGEWVEEQSLTKPRRYNGEQLRKAESVLLDSGLPVTILRLAGIYGPGRQHLLKKVASGQAPLTDAWTNRIHAEDAAGFMAHLLDLSERQLLAPVYLVSDGAPAPAAEVIRWLAEKMGVGTGEHQQVHNLNKRVSNRLMLATGYTLQYPDYRAGFGELIESES